LGIGSDAFLISTFGFGGKEKRMDICIIATELLRGWKIPAELHFVGSTLGLSEEIRRVGEMYGVEKHIHATSGFVENQRYRDFMLASDAAIQLRAYDFGQPSAALADCISAALPCVASRELANSCDAPEYVLTVPDRSSPLLVAEHLAAIWEGSRGRSANLEAWRSYMASHNFDHYVKRLREILELA
jgi:hypothetical protein